MRKRWIILVLLGLAVFLLTQLFPRIPQIQRKKSASESNPTVIPEVKPNRLTYAYLPSADSDMPLDTPYLFTDRLLSTIPLEALENYVGSYTLGDLQTKEGQSPSLNLNSAWLSGDALIPQARIRVELNPMTGKYEFRGGELFLPKPNVGISYEKDEEAGETKTFLNWKKEF